MRKIVKPKQNEECEYYSDFSGERFDHDIPEVVLKFEFGYGSPFDDSNWEFHLTHDESTEILQIIKNKISNNTKQDFAKTLKECEKKYDSSIESRDWSSCDFLASDICMCKFFLNSDKTVL
jgi:hypothetical protein